MSKIEIRSLTKIFGDSPKDALALLNAGKDKDEILKATHNAIGVHDISLDIEEGEIVVLMGLSGSGKSTLLRCLNRLIEPDAGTVTVDGENVMKLSPSALRAFRQKKFGMVFQNFALFPHRNVLQNVAYGLEVMGMERALRRDRAMEMIERVGLKGWEESSPHQLSGGMQQRVGLARALALDPDILLMDEAFSALDPLIRRDMQDELVRLQDELQKTIVFVSHDLDEALNIGDRIVLMRNGGVIQTGTAEDIMTAPADSYVSRFVADIDMSRVLTAASIMKRSEAVAVLGVDGPRTALRKMRHSSIANLFVLDRRHRLVGMINGSDTVSLLRRETKDFDSIIIRDITTVTPETPVSEIIPIMANLPYPLAVIDQDKRLKGVIVRGLLLEALTNGDSDAAPDAPAADAILETERVALSEKSKEEQGEVVA